jgi:hypothetical protein
MKPLKLTEQQSLRIAELPQGYRVIGVENRAPLVRKPTGRILRIQQDGRLVAVKPGLADRLAEEPDRHPDWTEKPAGEAARLAGGVKPTTPYTSICG